MTEPQNPQDIEPQDQVAALFMERKGYQGVAPVDVEKVEELPCWYYLYDIPDGRLELEVSWSGEGWETYVSGFTPR